ncbi:Alpha-amylase isozyme 3A [Tetrabaena socialis]|uniref:alpha-amylase n=1 Tax=Tetrabaena socialis TaxID=47790 RepID=A0A2J8A9J5_9CHLO|nr:Alpha-amylase isozyme 3A [Tetrabaena socialis]|eukprot:PNH09189.1 Alpha-amylase isozyme 3A [Tetrabaena socialis]
MWTTSPTHPSPTVSLLAGGRLGVAGGSQLTTVNCVVQGRRIDWGKWAITSNDPVFKGSGNPDTGEDYGPAPDLDHSNPELRAALVEWLRWLQRDLGFEGWRFDFARGYGARFITEYVDATTGADALNVGEVWVDMRWQGSNLEYNQDEARQRLCDWVRATGERSCAFDFPTKGILQEAVKRTQYDRLRDKQGKAPGLIGWWPGRAVTFVDNHDTGSTQQHWPFPAANVGIGYAYILTHPGIPCIFWDHLLRGDLRDTIAKLAALRRRAGVLADSPLEILAAEPDMYVARVANSLTVKMGPRFDMGALLPQERDGWQFVMSGKDWAVWERSGGLKQA